MPSCIHEVLFLGSAIYFWGGIGKRGSRVARGVRLQWRIGSWENLVSIRDIRNGRDHHGDSHGDCRNLNGFEADGVGVFWSVSKNFLFEFEILFAQDGQPFEERVERAILFFAFVDFVFGILGYLRGKVVSQILVHKMVLRGLLNSFDCAICAVTLSFLSVIWHIEERFWQYAAFAHFLSVDYERGVAHDGGEMVFVGATLL